MKFLTFALLLLLGVAYFAPQTTIYYASPNGTGDCSSSPCDLQTALSLTNISGSTLQLRGGIYNGLYQSTLSGVTVTNYPGEHPEIDSNYTATLGAAISSTDEDILLLGSFRFIPAHVITVDNEDMQISQYLGNNIYRVNRGWTGTTPVAHSAGASARARGNALTIWGADSTFSNIEIYDSNPVRAYNSTGGSLRGGTGVSVFGRGIKLINLEIHDNGDGIGYSESATDTETYGCIIYNNGYVATDRPHGHGMYVQNVNPSIKTFDEIISFNNFGLGVQAYGASQGHANNIRFKGIVSFNNGSPSYYEGTPTTNGDPNRRFGNLLSGSDVHPSENISIEECFLYHQAGKTVELAGLFLGRAPTGGNTGLIVRGCYIAEPFGALLALNQWSNVQVTGNTLIFHPELSGDYHVLARVSGSVFFDNNIYYGMTRLNNCIGGSFRATFFYNGVPSQCGPLRFAEWQAQGLDPNGSYFESLPTQNKVDVRPSIYQQGRAHIVVYNWQLLSLVAVDLSNSGLLDGQAYKIMNVQNYKGAPVLSGTYSASSPIVSLPMTDMAVTTPIGHVFTPQSTLPQFGAFVVLPMSGAVPTPTPPPLPSPTATATPTPVPSVTPTPRVCLRFNPKGKCVKWG